jgi:hypothetical protein
MHSHVDLHSVHTHIHAFTFLNHRLTLQTILSIDLASLIVSYNKQTANGSKKEIEMRVVCKYTMKQKSSCAVSDRTGTKNPLSTARCHLLDLHYINRMIYCVKQWERTKKQVLTKQRSFSSILTFCFFFTLI